MIRVSLIGNSNIANKYLIPAFNEHKDFKIINIASKNNLNKNIHDVEYFSNYNKAINDSIDLVYVSLPNSMHYDICKFALNNGKHVIVEKSLTTSLRDSKILINLAKKNKLILFENFQFQFHDQFKFIQSIVSSNELGSIKYINSSFTFPPFSSESNIRYQKKLGGGSLLDAGAYPLMVTNLLAKNENLVLLSAKTTERNYDVDISGAFTVLTSNTNIISNGTYSFNSQYTCSLNIIFTEGQINADRVFTAPPGFKANIKVTKNNNTKSYFFECNHFLNMLDEIIMSVNYQHKYNYEIMLRQSKLINQINRKCQN